jgi:hypothetical protein
VWFWFVRSMRIHDFNRLQLILHYSVWQVVDFQKLKQMTLKVSR